MTQISRIAITKSLWAVIGLNALALTGCSYPNLPGVAEPVPYKSWVERPATLTSDQTGLTETREIVYSDKAAHVIGPDDRVIWVSGVDVMNGKLQRFHQRIDRKSIEQGNFDFKQSPFVKTYHFLLHGDELSIEGRLALESFNATAMDRFYVEFLNSGAMNEAKVNAVMNAWKNILPQMRKKGLEGSNVILGGSKYEQSVNAIVLVRVGK